ncbi:MAG: DUF465 domain-containing protein [Pedosphaera sp.]|nr:DUF465 domain-containing protein [Pedosphaera sp.]
MDLHHPFTREFSEYKETIQSLRVRNEGFLKNFDEYHSLDDAIYRIEEEINFATDQEIDELKMRRAKLKDHLYDMVRRSSRTNLQHLNSPVQPRAG